MLKAPGVYAVSKKNGKKVELSIKKTEEAVWFAMRVTYKRELIAKQLLERQSIETFIPMRYETRRSGMRKKRELVPVIHNLIFVHTEQSKIQRAKERIPFLQYMTCSGSGEKIIVPEDQMQRFIAVAGTYDEQLIYFRNDEVNLAKGVKVRICGGEFDGQEGVFLKVKGARDKRVVIAIQGVVAVATASVHPSQIEIIP